MPSTWGFGAAGSQPATMATWGFASNLFGTELDPILLHTTTAQSRDHALTADRRTHALTASRRTHSIDINE